MSIEYGSRNDMWKFLARKVLGIDLLQFSGDVNERPYYHNYVQERTLLTNNAEKAIAMLKNKNERSEKIVEQLLEETGQKFQPFTRTVTVEKIGEMAQFTIRRLLKKLSEYLVQVRTNDVKIHKFAD
jgi:hypothetical protein